MIYKKKPLQVDAFKYDGDFIYDNGIPYVPNWAIEALRIGDLYYSTQGAEDCPPIFSSEQDSVQLLSILDIT